MSVASNIVVLEVNQEPCIGKLHHTTSGISVTGSKNEAAFEKSFSEVPDVTISSERDLSRRMTDICEVLCSASEWRERVDAKLRACFFGGAKAHMECLRSNL